VTRDLARAPSWLAALLLVLVAAVTLALRIVDLFVALAADATHRAAGLAARADEALTARWGMAPLGSALVVVDPQAGAR
jgi:hypothetical protein